MRQAKKAETLRPQVDELLRALDIKEAPVPVEAVAAHLGATIRYSPFDGELAGMLIRGDDHNPVIGVNSLHHVNRQRFTIAHECGHLLLHKGEVHIDKSFRVNLRDRNSSKAINPEEIEANRFAAELLMPYDMVMEDLADQDIDLENDIELKELAGQYEVSVQALTLRITHLLRSIT